MKIVPRFVASHPVLFVVLVYLLVVGLAALFFWVLGTAQGNPDDPRNWQVAVIFAAALLFPFGRSLHHARSRPLPPFSPRR